MGTTTWASPQIHFRFHVFLRQDFRKASRVQTLTCGSAVVTIARSSDRSGPQWRDDPLAGNDAHSSSDGKLMHLRPSCQTSGCDPDTELKISVGGACGGGDGPVMD